MHLSTISEILNWKGGNIFLKTKHIKAHLLDSQKSKLPKYIDGLMKEYSTRLLAKNPRFNPIIPIEWKLPTFVNTEETIVANTTKRSAIYNQILKLPTRNSKLIEVEEIHSYISPNDLARLMYVAAENLKTL